MLCGNFASRCKIWASKRRVLIRTLLKNHFEISLTRISYGPNKHQPRLVWAQGPVPGGLLRLKDALESALQKESLVKNYLLHLTLARFPEKKFSEFKIKTLEEKVLWKEKIASFVLYESHLGKNGADYEELWVNYSPIYRLWR